MTDDDLLAEAKAIALAIRLLVCEHTGQTPLYSFLVEHSPHYQLPEKGAGFLTEDGSFIHYLLMKHFHEQQPLTQETLYEARTKIGRRATPG